MDLVGFCLVYVHFDRFGWVSEICGLLAPRRVATVAGKNRKLWPLYIPCSVGLLADRIEFR